MLARSRAENSVAAETRPVPTGLLPPSPEQFGPRNATRKTEVILHLRFPPGHRFGVIDDQCISLGSREVNGRRKPRQAPAYDDDFGGEGLGHAAVEQCKYRVVGLPLIFRNLNRNPNRNLRFGDRFITD